MQEERLAQAKHLLLSTDLAASGIAPRVGLGEACAFNRFFKRHTGLPPGAWRRRRDREA
ncbi:MAG: helix-turn-helix domain-containing protein [Planctomycetota bacterium]